MLLGPQNPSNYPSAQIPCQVGKAVFSVNKELPFKIVWIILSPGNNESSCLCQQLLSSALWILIGI